MRDFIQLAQHPQANLNTLTFLGLNRGMTVQDGEMNDMLNLCSDYFPQMAPVHPRVDSGITLEGNYHGSIAKGNDLYVAAGTKLYKNGVALEDFELEDNKKMMVSMGSTIVIWPDKKWYNTTTDEHGTMGKEWKTHTETSGGSGEAGAKVQYVYKQGDVSSMVTHVTYTGKPATGNTFDYSITVRFGVAKTEKAVKKKAVKNIKLKAGGVTVDMGDQTVEITSRTTAATFKSVTYKVTGSNVNLCTGTTITAEVSTVSGDSGIFWSLNKNTTHYVNVVPYSQSESEEVVETQVEGNEVTFFPCDMDGNEINKDTNLTISATMPSTTKAASYWFCTLNNTMYIYDTTSKSWNMVENTYIGIRSTIPINAFDDGDAIYMTASDGEWDYKTDVSSSAYEYTKSVIDEMLGTSEVIVTHKDDLLVISGLITMPVTVGNFTAEVRIPDFDFVCESNNRIWGCRYGESSLSGEPVNELMACRQGDFKNWEAYEGVGTDSYAVSLGSDGAFTGAISLNGTPCFFKEGVLHRVSGTLPANYSTNTLSCRGVDAGDSKSLCRLEQYLIYKCRGDVLIWAGGTSFNSVGKKLGQTALEQDTIAATVHGTKYYLLLADGLYVYDMEHAMWHMESNEGLVDVIATDEDLWFIGETAEGIAMLKQSTEAQNVSSDVQWHATFGTYGYDTKTRKYLSRYDLRMMLPTGSIMNVEIQYDHDGVWHRIGSLRGRNIQSFLLPVIPRRCDHCQLRLSGRGRMKLLGLARVMEQGSDV